MPECVERTDVLVIGGGVLGLATAWQLQRVGVEHLVVIEKEAAVAQHQTGRNSGVLHSGIYYSPGSMKADTCRLGKLLMEAFCVDEGIRYERCGKVVVATDSTELPALERILARAVANGVIAERIAPERLHELEPRANGLGALWVPETGIVDFVGVCQALVRRIRASGGVVRCGVEAMGTSCSRGTMVVETNQGPIEARVVVACAGLQADRVARMFGIDSPVAIVPFRGEYHLLGERGCGLVKNLIYPVPDPRFPFLGVHFTRRFDGSIDCGPNAVLAMGREAYDRESPNWEDLLETLAFPGFWRLARRHFAYGLDELRRSCSKSAFVKALQKLVPDITEGDLVPGPNGIRAQAVGADGTLLSDFLIEERQRIVCVLNAPSPAATASLEIGRIVADKVRVQLELDMTR